MSPLRIAIRVAVGLQLLLGLAVWLLDAYAILPLHLLLGFGIVGLILASAFLARSTASPGMLALAVAWAVLLPIFGYGQGRLLLGDWHWIVRVLHLAVGLASIGIVEALVRGREVSRPAAAPARA